MPESVTIQMIPEGPFRAAVAALPADDPLSRLGSVDKVYVQDLGARELDANSLRKTQRQAIYMEHWDGVSLSVDIAVILDGLAGSLNRGRVAFRYTDEMARSLERGFLKKVTDAGLFIVEGFDCECDTLDGIDIKEYVIRDGSRSFTGVIEGVVPVICSHLATKFYVDDAGGTTLAPIFFTHTTSSPLFLASLSAGDVIDEVEVVIVTDFDDVASFLRVGIIGDQDLVFSSSEIETTMIGQYKCSGNFLLPVSETLQMIISPGASTQGDGFVVVKIRRAIPPCP